MAVVCVECGGDPEARKNPDWEPSTDISDIGKSGAPTVLVCVECGTSYALTWYRRQDTPP